MVDIFGANFWTTTQEGTNGCMLPCSDDVTSRSDGSWSPSEGSWSPESMFPDVDYPFSVSSSNTSGKYQKPNLKRSHQRHAANQRERKRMKTINDAFEGLRERIPTAGAGEHKLSKVDTLRLAIRYIQQLTQIRDTFDEGGDPNEQNQKQNKVIIRCQVSNACMMDSTPSVYGGVYGHSLSWADEKQIKYGPKHTLVAKLWKPAVLHPKDMQSGVNTNTSGETSMEY